jgi:hypothetical protein
MRRWGSIMDDLGPQPRVLRNHGSPWTPENDAELRTYWCSNESAREIARLVGRTRSAIFERAGSIGLPKRVYIPNNGIVGNRDAEYADLCLAQGGFVTPKIIDGVLVHIRPPGAFA